MMWQNDASLVLTMVAKGVGVAVAYCGVVVVLMYRVVEAAGFLS